MADFLSAILFLKFLKINLNQKKIFFLKMIEIFRLEKSKLKLVIFSI